MAGGIDWFRWHHGSVTDPKFQLVARRAGASVAEVIAVWAVQLEAASMAEVRGSPGTPDFEALDCALGMPDGRVLAIYLVMKDRKLIDEDGRILAWERRQPKREREDNTAAERKRRQRASTDADPRPTPQDETTGAHVTPCHAESHQKTPRGEESREEEKKVSSLRSDTPRRKRRAAAQPQCVGLADLIAEGVDPQHAADWLGVREGKKLTLTKTAWDDVKAQADAAGLTVAQAVHMAAANSWGGFRASWVHKAAPGVTPDPRAPGGNRPPMVNKQEALEQRNRQAAEAWLKEAAPAAATEAEAT